MCIRDRCNVGPLLLTVVKSTDQCTCKVRKRKKNENTLENTRDKWRNYIFVVKTKGQRQISTNSELRYPLILFYVISK